MIASPEVDWFALLEAEVNKAGKSRRIVADELGISRTAVSLVLSGKYAAGTNKIAARVLARYHNSVQCPHLERSLMEHECRKFASRPFPASNPRAFKQWEACRHCPINPIQNEIEQESEAC